MWALGQTFPTSEGAMDGTSGGREMAAKRGLAATPNKDKLHVHSCPSKDSSHQPSAQGVFWQTQPQVSRGLRKIPESALCTISSAGPAEYRATASHSDCWRETGSLACASRYGAGVCLLLPAPPMPSRRPDSAGPVNSADLVEKLPHQHKGENLKMSWLKTLSC